MCDPYDPDIMSLARSPCSPDNNVLMTDRALLGEWITMPLATQGTVRGDNGLYAVRTLSARNGNTNVYDIVKSTENASFSHDLSSDRKRCQESPRRCIKAHQNTTIRVVFRCCWTSVTPHLVTERRPTNRQLQHFIRTTLGILALLVVSIVSSDTLRRGRRGSDCRCC